LPRYYYPWRPPPIVARSTILRLSCHHQHRRHHSSPSSAATLSLAASTTQSLESSPSVILDSLHFYPTLTHHCHATSVHQAPTATLVSSASGAFLLLLLAPPSTFSIHLWRERKNWKRRDWRFENNMIVLITLININRLSWSLTSRPLYHRLSPSAPARFHVCCRWHRW
jgi:hypothetical protein